MKAYIAVPVTLLMLYRAWSHKSLTPAGIVAALVTAVAHAVHPSNIPFTLLIVFFFAGTTVTKVKHNLKSKLTIQSTGSSGGEGARTHVQVFANSIVASILSLMHVYQLHKREKSGISAGFNSSFPWDKDLLMVGIIANYAAVAADTFSSELGILARSRPRLLTSRNFRKVPPGTNGGVTWEGLVAGLLGSLVIVTTAMALSFSRDEPAYPELIPGIPLKEPQAFTWGMILWGGLGSVLDSLLGGWLQQSVIDTRSGRIVEGAGGKKVLVSQPGQNSTHYQKGAEVKKSLLGGEGKDAIPIHPTDDQAVVDRIEGNLNKEMGATDKYDSKKKFRTPSFGDEQPSRKVESGLSLLDNNEVNFLMALTMSLGAMGVAGRLWGIPFESILQL